MKLLENSSSTANAIWKGQKFYALEVVKEHYHSPWVFTRYWLWRTQLDEKSYLSQIIPSFHNRSIKDKRLSNGSVMHSKIVFVSDFIIEVQYNATVQFFVEITNLDSWVALQKLRDLFNNDVYSRNRNKTARSFLRTHPTNSKTNKRVGKQLSSSSNLKFRHEK